MPTYRVSTIARLLGVSDDSVRRWIDQGLLEADNSGSGPIRITGQSVVDFLGQNPHPGPQPIQSKGVSVRNQIPGIITKIVKDKVMSQIELQCGNSRIVSLISTEATEELGLEVGAIATAQVKATNVSLNLVKGDRI